MANETCKETILPAISKEMERILYTQLQEYLPVNNLLSEHQFSFRKYHSTASALLDCTNNWYINMDRNFFYLVVFIDLKSSPAEVPKPCLLTISRGNSIFGFILFL